LAKNKNVRAKTKTKFTINCSSIKLVWKILKNRMEATITNQQFCLAHSYLLWHCMWGSSLAKSRISKN
jgi:hypothetical protein